MEHPGQIHAPATSNTHIRAHQTVFFRGGYEYPGADFFIYTSENF